MVSPLGSHTVPCMRPAWVIVLVAALAAACEDERLGLDQPIQPQSDATVQTPDADAIDTGVVANVDVGVVEDASVAPDAAPDDTGVTSGPRTDIGTVPIGTVTLGTDGRSGPITFELPQGVVSFTVSLVGALEGTYIVRSLSGPTGVLVSDDDSALSQLERLLFGPFGAQFFSPNRVVQHRGAMAALFPNNPGVTVAGGPYTMELEGFRIQGANLAPYSGPITVTVHYRTALPMRGRLDLSLYFSGAQGIDASSAPTNTLIQDAVRELGTIYAQTGLRIGTIAYHDIDPSFQTIEGFLDGSSTVLEDMFALSAGNGPGLHFFFVDRFEGGIGGSVAGIAGGVPGPPLNPGTAGAGVAVALSTANGDAGVLAHVMAHEGGHWLGLFHTSELIGTSDQIPDTPEGQGGNTYLMFPAVGGGTQVSANQASVVRSHIEVVAE